MDRQTAEQILRDHIDSPRNAAPLHDPTHSASGKIPTCGDEVTVQFRLEGAEIREARFSATSCALCSASASLLTEFLIGLTMDQAVDACQRVRRCLRGEEVADISALDALFAIQCSPLRVGCLALPWETACHALRGGPTAPTPGSHQATTKPKT